VVLPFFFFFFFLRKKGLLVRNNFANIYLRNDGSNQTQDCQAGEERRGATRLGARDHWAALDGNKAPEPTVDSKGVERSIVIGLVGGSEGGAIGRLGRRIHSDTERVGRETSRRGGPSAVLTNAVVQS